MRMSRGATTTAAIESWPSASNAIERAGFSGQNEHDRPRHRSWRV